jgi:hypothetical protein
MRAVILTLIAVGAGAVVAPARAEVRVGVFAAPTLSYFADVNGGDGFHVDVFGRDTLGGGAVVSWQPSARLTLELQPMLVSKGADLRYASSQPLAAVNVEKRLSYFEVPVLVKYALGGRRVRPYLLAGPTLGVRRSASLVADGVRREDAITKTDLGFGFGAGARIPAGRAMLFAEAQYTLSVGETFAFDARPAVVSAGRAIGNYEPHNRAFQLKLGVTLPVIGSSGR